MKEKLKLLFKKLWLELKDVKTLILFVIVCAVLYSTVWIPFLFGIITGNKYWYGVAAASQVVWLGPVPFFPIAIAVTFGIKAIFNKIICFKKKKQHDRNIEDNPDSGSQEESLDTKINQKETKNG